LQSITKASGKLDNKKSPLKEHVDMAGQLLKN
jgi:hypothetical protein